MTTIRESLRFRTCLLWVLCCVSCGGDSPGGASAGDGGAPEDDGAASGSGDGGASGSGDEGASRGEGGSPKGEGGSPGEVDCTTYCDLMEANCPADMIHPHEACHHICDHPTVAVFSGEGSSADTADNTLGCRIHYAELAASLDGAAKDAACASANLSGGDVCGSLCENYCQLVMNGCVSSNVVYSGPDLYPDLNACMTACAGFSTEVLDGIAQPDQLFGYGDTVQCRLHHGQMAVATDETDRYSFDTHCQHASKDSVEGVCTDDAEPNPSNYCAFALQHCTSTSTSDPLFPAGTTVQACKQAVGDYVDGGIYALAGFDSFTHASGATLGCLNYWIVQAPLDAETNCAKAGLDPIDWEPEGQGVCHD